MSEFIMLIGPDGCGKSTTARDYEKYGFKHISSDAIRKELLGSEEDQSKNDLVFDTMLKRTREAILNNENVIYDATNLSERRRKGFLNQLPKTYFKKIAMIVATNPEQIEINDKSCGRTVGDNVIYKHLISFQPPSFLEGWDEILVVRNQGNNISLPALRKKNDIPHDSPWHQRGVKEHMDAAYSAAEEASEDPLVCEILKYHDIGKVYTKRFADGKGNPTQDAHFYGHHNYGAYLMLCSSLMNKLELSWYISHHMDLLFDTEENLVKKYGDERVDVLKKIRFYDQKYN